jgi:hypothetical protein
MLVSAGPGRADSTPVGPLPAGPVATITTKPGLLVAVALPRALTRGDTSAKAVKSATHKVHSA